MRPSGQMRCVAAAPLAELAMALVRLSRVAQRLLAVHVPDRQGRCRGCTTPGTGLPAAVWPCALHFYATAATTLQGTAARVATAAPGAGVVGG